MHKANENINHKNNIKKIVALNCTTQYSTTLHYTCSNSLSAFKPGAAHFMTSRTDILYLAMNERLRNHSI